MYTMLSQLPVRRVVTEQVPILAASLVLAEIFFKFGSFTLEAVAFLATWYALDALRGLVSGALRS